MCIRDRGIIGASLEVFKMLKESNALHDKLVENVNYFRDQMTAAGFDIKPTQSAICAVMSVSYTHLDVYKRQQCWDKPPRPHK